MLPRVMPLVTFRCPVCLAQLSVRLTKLLRRKGKPDVYAPEPRCANGHRRRKMEAIQIDYAAPDDA